MINLGRLLVVRARSPTVSLLLPLLLLFRHLTFLLLLWRGLQIGVFVKATSSGSVLILQR